MNTWGSFLGFGLSASLFFSVPANAELWDGFYKTTNKPEQIHTSKSLTVGCMAAILSAQERHGIPNNLLLAIGIQEAGRQINGKTTIWPWAVNAEGNGVFFKSREQAIGWIKSQQAQGVRSIDVGCMQINLRWHQEAFSSLEEAFDPMVNADYAARFLSNLRRQEGSWWEAAGSYHSKTAVHRDRYLTALAHNQKIANSLSVHAQAASSDTPVQALRSDVKLQSRPSVLWGAAETDRSAFSIYSHIPLTPVLPDFEERL